MDLALANFTKNNTRQNLPKFKVGLTVRIHQRIKEGDKQRLQVFEGMIINVNKGQGINGMITVRKIVDGVGVEKVFPVHSPVIARVEITKESRTRRSKLYYLRERSGKAARMKTTLLEGQIFDPIAYGQTPAAEVVQEPVPVPEAVAAAPEAPAAEPAPTAEATA